MKQEICVFVIYEEKKVKSNIIHYVHGAPYVS